MSHDLAAYLDILCREMGTSMVPRDERVRRVPEFGRRLLTFVLQRERALPALQREALAHIAALLDELVAEVGSIEGGMVLVPQLMRFVRAEPDYATAEPYLQSAIRLLGTSPTARARRLEAQLARIGMDLTSAFTRAVAAQESAAAGAVSAPAAEPLDAKQKGSLAAWLRTQFSEGEDLAVGAVDVVIGGGSKQTLIVRLSGSRKLPAEVVVRLDYSKGVVGSSVVDEYRLIEAVHAAGVRVPQPLGAEPSGSVLGAPFIVVGRVPGRNIGDWIEVFEPSRAFAIGLAQTLARLHGVPPRAAGDRLAGAETSIRGRVEHELAFYERSWRASGETSPMMEQAFAWLRRHVDQSEGRRAIVHADVGCHNMLGHEGELSALLDWETAVVGHPAQDLLYVRHTVEQMMPWEEFLAEYEKAGGTLPNAAETEFYRVYIAVFRMHFMFLARSFVTSGFSGSLVHAYAGNRVSLHAEGQVYSALADALAREAAELAG